MSDSHKFWKTQAGADSARTVFFSPDATEIDERERRSFLSFLIVCSRTVQVRFTSQSVFLPRPRLPPHEEERASGPQENLKWNRRQRKSERESSSVYFTSSKRIVHFVCGHYQLLSIFWRQSRDWQSTSDSTRHLSHDHTDKKNIRTVFACVTWKLRNPQQSFHRMSTL